MMALTASPEQMPVFYIKTTEKKLALTFDISWGKEIPERLLHALKEQDEQKATFFLSGPWSRDHPDVVRAIVRDGHEIASHGQAHVNLSQYSSSQIAANIEAADAILKSISQRSPRFFRPPNGDYDATVIETAKSLGYETIIWSVDSLDWKNPGLPTIHSRVIDGVFPGAILLFHASDSAKQTPAAIPGIISKLRSQGWELVTLGELWKLGEPVRDDPRGRPDKPNTAIVPSPSGI